MREQLYKTIEGRMGVHEGKDFERDLFGLPRVGDPKYREELSKISGSSGYVPFAPAFELSQKIQPTHHRPFATKLTHEVANALRKDKSRNNLKVRFWTTVETPLDTFHGTDAIMEVLEDGYKPEMIRLGATTANQDVKERREAKKADLEIESSWLNVEDEEKLTKEKIPQLANQIKSFFDKRRIPDQKAA